MSTKGAELMLYSESTAEKGLGRGASVSAFV